MELIMRKRIERDDAQKAKVPYIEVAQTMEVVPK